jgi:hypothetical protein
MEIQDIIQGLTQAQITAITSPDERSLIVNTTLNQAVIFVNGVFKQASFTDTDDIPEGTTNKYITTSDLSQITTNQTNITNLQTGKEDAFTKNTAFNKDFGTSAGEVLEGDTTTITPTQSGDISTNNAKVSFPEAPSDGKQYARKDAGWDEVTGGGGSSLIACCPFGAKSDSIGKFLIANGKSSDADDSTKPKTRQPIAAAGTLTKLAYKTKDGSTSTRMKIHVNGSVEATVVLSSMNANDGGIETISVSVDAGDYVEIEYDGSQKPGECTMYFIQELS